MYVTRKIRLRPNRELHTWVVKTSHTSRYTYNRAVAELMSMDVWRTIVDDSWYAFPPSNTTLRYDTYKELTRCRAEKDWVRGCHSAYGRGAIDQAVVACKRAINDVSIHMPFRRKDGRIVISSIIPPTRRSQFQLHIPGFGMLKTKDPIDPDWEMKSFKIVDVTKVGTQPKFELHISITHEPPEHKPTGIVRGVDVGGRHLAAVADSDGNECVYNTRHKKKLREIDRLKSERDRKRRGGRKWTEVVRKIKRLQEKTNNIATDTTNQSVAKITTGVDAVIIEDLHVRAMTTHGGNRKRRLNRSMRENRAGTFLAKLETKSGMKGVEVKKVDPRNTSITCHKCGCVDKTARSGDVFHCMVCEDYIHADVNAAHNIQAAGMVVVRRRGGSKAKNQSNALSNRGGRKDIGVYLCM